jgi:MATE family multidrug resistance protein
MSERADITPPSPTLAGQARDLLALGLPLVGSQLAQIAITTTDVMMLGWYDVTALAASSLAGPIYFAILITVAGFGLAVMPMVASADATGDHRQVRRVTRMGLWIVIAFGALATIPFQFFEPVFLLMGQEAEISRLGGEYMAILGFSLVPALIIFVIRSYLSALELTRVILIVTIITFFFNAAINYVLIFGNFGAPEMGVHGAAIASVLGQILGAVWLCLYALKKTPQYELFKNFHRADWDAIRQVFVLGWPIGITLLSEVGLFAVTSVLMGLLGEIALAAHGVALQIASITFMVHLGLSQAITVKVGQAHGRSDVQSQKLSSQAAMLLSALAVVVTVSMFLLIPEVLVGAFIDPNDPARDAILAAGATLLAVAALFQTVDAAQVMGLGMLRGVQDTRVPMIFAAISYWIIGVPASYILGFPMGLEGVGVWLGLSLGLATAGVLLQHRYWTQHLA